ncbi:MAG: peptidoglycan-binding protein [Planctomycetes bacterium]|nr:peptidoglycan-binding protein [Planctomycetota bacterium]
MYKVLILLIVLLLAGCAKEPEPEPIHIQNIFEIQQLLTDAGYYAGPVDGKWGKLTDRAYCDWCAAQYFKGDK